MQATGKHFPGHGGVKEDSHIAEPIDTRSYKDLIDHDLKPFIELKRYIICCYDCAYNISRY